MLLGKSRKYKEVYQKAPKYLQKYKNKTFILQTQKYLQQEL